VCYDLVYTCEPDLDRKHLQTIKGNRLQGTFEWIRESPNYKAWLVEDSVDRLWITGGLGVGKTMLSLFITDELEEKTQDETAQVRLLYFFCNSQHRTQSSACTILRSWLYQICSSAPRRVLKCIREGLEKLQTRQRNL